MSAAADAEPDTGPAPRPDLQIVRDETPPGPPPEEDTEITGPIPVVDADGNTVTARAPIDVRAKEAAVAALAHRPRFATRPPSFAESLEYSQSGDWAATDNTAKRVAHGLATVVAYIATYPLDLVLRARGKPIGFVLTVAVVLTLVHLL